MTARTVTALLLAVSTTMPLAHAEDAQKGIRVGAEYAATIAAEVERIGYGMGAACGFVSLLMPSGNNQIVFGGGATAWGTLTAQLTYLKCTIENDLGDSDSTAIAYSLPTAYTAKSTLWRNMPTRICVEGFAVFGPTPVVTITLERICETDLTR